MGIGIRASALDAARRYFEDAGARGQEGTGMLAGQISAEQRDLTRFFAPDQRAGTYPNSWVEVTDLGKRQLALELRSGERWLARIHSHPGEAFHSPTDDANPGLTADGAVSIVVPFFGLGLRTGITACAIFEHRNGRWVSRTPEELALEITRGD